MKQIDTSSSKQPLLDMDNQQPQNADLLNEVKDEDDAVDEEEEKKEIDQIMKDEDINLLPENLDVAEIDKLTGIPKHNGKN